MGWYTRDFAVDKGEAGQGANAPQLAYSPPQMRPAQAASRAGCGRIDVAERMAASFAARARGATPMADSIMYHEGNRRLQDEFDSRRISDRLEEKLTRTRFTDDDRAFIEGAIYFFLASADAEGRPDCSFKGGAPGFVRVTAADELAFPDYDGNGMFKSLGNLLVNPAVGLPFIDMHGKPRRLRVNGMATLSRDDPLLAATVGAQLIVRVKTRAIVPNCPRYIPSMQLAEPSQYVPRPAPRPSRAGVEGLRCLQGLRASPASDVQGSARQRLAIGLAFSPARGRLAGTRSQLPEVRHEDAARRLDAPARPRPVAYGSGRSADDRGTRKRRPLHRAGSSAFPTACAPTSTRA
jgi:uncharacterized protein